METTCEVPSKCTERVTGPYSFCLLDGRECTDENEKTCPKKDCPHC